MKISVGSFYDYKNKVNSLSREYQEKIAPAGGSIYTSKIEEAKSWPEQEPVILKDEADSLGIPLGVLVGRVIDAFNKWKKFTSKVESKRVVSNKLIGESDSNLEKDRIVKSFEAFCNQTYQEFLEE